MNEYTICIGDYWNQNIHYTDIHPDFGSLNNNLILQHHKLSLHKFRLSAARNKLLVYPHSSTIFLAPGNRFRTHIMTKIVKCNTFQIWANYFSIYVTHQSRLGDSGIIFT
jgi:hypothetical protein